MKKFLTFLRNLIYLLVVTGCIVSSQFMVTELVVSQQTDQLLLQQAGLRQQLEQLARPQRRADELRELGLTLLDAADAAEASARANDATVTR